MRMTDRDSGKWYWDLPILLEKRGLTMQHAAEFCGVDLATLEIWISPRGRLSTAIEMGLMAIFCPGELADQSLQVINTEEESRPCEDCGKTVSRVRQITPLGQVDSRWKFEYEGSMWLNASLGGIDTLHVKCPDCTREFFRKWKEYANSSSR
jgi:endogenous inhibitor of DNA gyrase (YacG/DUF329 family)